MLAGQEDGECQETVQKPTKTVQDGEVMRNERKVFNKLCSLWIFVVLLDVIVSALLLSGLRTDTAWMYGPYLLVVTIEFVVAVVVCTLYLISMGFMAFAFAHDNANRLNVKVALVLVFIFLLYLALVCALSYFIVFIPWHSFWHLIGAPKNTHTDVQSPPV